MKKSQLNERKKHKKNNNKKLVVKSWARSIAHQVTLYTTLRGFPEQTYAGSKSFLWIAPLCKLKEHAPKKHGDLCSSVCICVKKEGTI